MGQKYLFIAISFYRTIVSRVKKALRFLSHDFAQTNFQTIFLRPRKATDSNELREIEELSEGENYHNIKDACGLKTNPQLTINITLLEKL